MENSTEKNPWSGAFLPGMTEENIYLPKPAVIKEIITENELVKTFVLRFEDAMAAKDFIYEPGQFMMVSAPHCGEAPISFSSSPSRPGTFSLTIRKAGKLTSAVHALGVGDMIGVRGPYGKPFPMAALKGKNLLFVAGGIGLAPLRSAITYCLDHREEYGRICVLYGCKHPKEICFTGNIKDWQGEGLDCRLTVDECCSSWNGRVGLVTGLLDDREPAGEDNAALVCGPGIMIRFVLERLQALGFRDENVITTLERHMKCGVGVCNHCYLDGRLVCTDGPVFQKSELPRLESL